MLGEVRLLPCIVDSENVSMENKACKTKTNVITIPFTKDMLKDVIENLLESTGQYSL